MTREDFIRMARQVRDGGHWNQLDLINFASLVAAAEREACAKVCDDWPNGRDDVYSIGKAIRARGGK